MKITFYGTRGSCPTPGKDTLKYGGNTACVVIESKNGSKLVLDAGTGIRVLGDEMVGQHEDIHLLLSHNHHDHIQGFPFFKPIYQANRNIFIYPAETQPSHPTAIIDQMNGSYFPLNADELKANISFCDIDWHNQPIKVNHFYIYRQFLNHPNGGHAYVIESEGKRVAYVTDNELSPPSNRVTSPYEWKEFLLGADLVIHDGQYVEADMPLKHGWGHSLIGEVIELAKCSHVQKLAIYSHDPDRTDADLDAWQEKIDQLNLDCHVFMSREGQCIEL